MLIYNVNILIYMLAPTYKCGRRMWTQMVSLKTPPALSVKQHNTKTVGIIVMGLYGYQHLLTTVAKNLEDFLTMPEN